MKFSSDNHVRLACVIELDSISSDIVNVYEMDEILSGSTGYC